MKKFIVKEWAELISDPICMRDQDQLVFKHADLPLVKDEMTVTLRINIDSNKGWCFIFVKGSIPDHHRTPSLSLTDKCELFPRYTTNKNWDSGTGPPAQALSEALQLFIAKMQMKYLFTIFFVFLQQLNKWYHIAVTVSDLEKRLDLYVNGQWLESGCIAQVVKEHIIFNTKPLYIGRTTPASGFSGRISNVRYFNWRLSADEVKKDSLNF